MQKLVYASLFFAMTSCALADSTESATNGPAISGTNNIVANSNSLYIDRQAYIQDPYAGQPSKGGTQNVTESELATMNVWQKLFTTGTWNDMSMFGYAYTGGYNNYSYSSNLFAQTGQIAGFSFGGAMVIANPFPLNGINPPQGYADEFLPTNQVTEPAEMFVEYQYSNIIQADVGRIAINNSPWLSQAYYNNIQTLGATYQGALLNVNPGGGWLLTALGFNQALPVGAIGFNDLTMYNTGFDYGTQTANVLNNPSGGTYAVGASFAGLDNNYNLRLWDYNFANYANLAYADNSLKMVANKDLSFNLAAQLGYEQGTNDNVFEQAGDGNVNSTFYGLQAGMNYKWFGLNVAMNSIFGPSGSYLNGGVVSPYTYEIATDPLYTTSYMMGMVEKGAGSAYKITPSFSFLDNNLSISPSFAYYSTVVVPSSQEYDLVISYNVPQIKGLLFTVDSAYMTQASYTNPFVGGPTGGNAYIVQVGASYLY